MHISTISNTWYTNLPPLHVANKESPLDSNAVFKAYKLGVSLLSLYVYMAICEIKKKIISAKMLSMKFLIYYIVVKLLVISLLYVRLHLDLDDNCNFIMEYSPPW